MKHFEFSFHKNLETYNLHILIPVVFITKYTTSGWRNIELVFTYKNKNRVFRFSFEERGIKYFVFPKDALFCNGSIKHFTTANQLISLYGVNPKDCIIINNTKDFTRYSEKYSKVVHLIPRSQGDYKEYLEYQLNCIK